MIVAPQLGEGLDKVATGRRVGPVSHHVLASRVLEDQNWISTRSTLTPDSRDGKEWFMTLSAGSPGIVMIRCWH